MQMLKLMKKLVEVFLSPISELGIDGIALTDYLMGMYHDATS